MSLLLDDYSDSESESDPIIDDKHLNKHIINLDDTNDIEIIHSTSILDPFETFSSIFEPLRGPHGEPFKWIRWQSAGIMPAKLQESMLLEQAQQQPQQTMTDSDDLGQSNEPFPQTNIDMVDRDNAEHTSQPNQQNNSVELTAPQKLQTLSEVPKKPVFFAGIDDVNFDSAVTDPSKDDKDSTASSASKTAKSVQEMTNEELTSSISLISSLQFISTIEKTEKDYAKFAQGTGFGKMMLQKWGVTRGLGKDEEGIVNPVPVVVRDKKAGLGAGKELSDVLMARMNGCEESDTDSDGDEYYGSTRRNKSKEGSKASKSAIEVVPDDKSAQLKEMLNLGNLNDVKIVTKKGQKDHQLGNKVKSGKTAQPALIIEDYRSLDGEAKVYRGGMDSVVGMDDVQEADLDPETLAERRAKHHLAELLLETIRRSEQERQERERLEQLRKDEADQHALRQKQEKRQLLLGLKHIKDSLFKYVNSAYQQMDEIIAVDVERWERLEVLMDQVLRAIKDSSTSISSSKTSVPQTLSMDDDDDDDIIGSTPINTSLNRNHTSTNNPSKNPLLPNPPQDSAQSFIPTLSSSDPTSKPHFQRISAHITLTLLLLHFIRFKLFLQYLLQLFQLALHTNTYPKLNLLRYYQRFNQLEMRKYYLKRSQFAKSGKASANSDRSGDHTSSSDHRPRKFEAQSEYNASSRAKRKQLSNWSNSHHTRDSSDGEGRSFDYDDDYSGLVDPATSHVDKFVEKQSRHDKEYDFFGTQSHTGASKSKNQLDDDFRRNMMNNRHDDDFLNDLGGNQSNKRQKLNAGFDNASDDDVVVLGDSDDDDDDHLSLIDSTHGKFDSKRGKNGGKAKIRTGFDVQENGDEDDDIIETSLHAYNKALGHSATTSKAKDLRDDRKHSKSHSSSKHHQNDPDHRYLAEFPAPEDTDTLSELELTLYKMNFAKKFATKVESIFKCLKRLLSTSISKYDLPMVDLGPFGHHLGHHSHHHQQSSHTTTPQPCSPTQLFDPLAFNFTGLFAPTPIPHSSLQNNQNSNQSRTPTQTIPTLFTLPISTLLQLFQDNLKTIQPYEPQLTHVFTRAEVKEFDRHQYNKLPDDSRVTNPVLDHEINTDLSEEDKQDISELLNANLFEKVQQQPTAQPSDNAPTMHDNDDANTKNLQSQSEEVIEVASIKQTPKFHLGSSTAGSRWTTRGKSMGNSANDPKRHHTSSTQQGSQHGTELSTTQCKLFTSIAFPEYSISLVLECSQNMQTSAKSLSQTTQTSQTPQSQVLHSIHNHTSPSLPSSPSSSTTNTKIQLHPHHFLTMVIVDLYSMIPHAPQLYIDHSPLFTMFSPTNHAKPNSDSTNIPPRSQSTPYSPPIFNTRLYLDILYKGQPKKEDQFQTDEKNKTSVTFSKPTSHNHHLLSQKFLHLTKKLYITLKAKFVFNFSHFVDCFAFEQSPHISPPFALSPMHPNQISGYNSHTCAANISGLRLLWKPPANTKVAKDGQTGKTELSGKSVLSRDPAVIDLAADDDEQVVLIDVSDNDGVNADLDQDGLQIVTQSDLQHDFLTDMGFSNLQFQVLNKTIAAYAHHDIVHTPQYYRSPAQLQSDLVLGRHLDGTMARAVLEDEREAASNSEKRKQDDSVDDFNYCSPIEEEEMLLAGAGETIFTARTNAGSGQRGQKLNIKDSNKQSDKMPEFSSPVRISPDVGVWWVPSEGDKKSTKKPNPFYNSNSGRFDVHFVKWIDCGTFLYFFETIVQPSLLTLLKNDYFELKSTIVIDSDGHEQLQHKSNTAESTAIVDATSQSPPDQLSLHISSKTKKHSSDTKQHGEMTSLHHLTTTIYTILLSFYLVCPTPLIYPHLYEPSLMNYDLLTIPNTTTSNMDLTTYPIHSNPFLPSLPTLVPANSTNSLNPHQILLHAHAQQRELYLPQTRALFTNYVINNYFPSSHFSRLQKDAASSEHHQRISQHAPYSFSDLFHLVYLKRVPRSVEQIFTGIVAEFEQLRQQPPAQNARFRCYNMLIAFIQSVFRTLVSIKSPNMIFLATQTPFPHNAHDLPVTMHDTDPHTMPLAPCSTVFTTHTTNPNSNIKSETNDDDIIDITKEIRKMHLSCPITPSPPSFHASPPLYPTQNAQHCSSLSTSIHPLTLPSFSQLATTALMLWHLDHEAIKDKRNQIKEIRFPLQSAPASYRNPTSKLSTAPPLPPYKNSSTEFINTHFDTFSPYSSVAVSYPPQSPLTSPHLSPPINNSQTDSSQPQHHHHPKVLGQKPGVEPDTFCTFFSSIQALTLQSPMDIFHQLVYPPVDLDTNGKVGNDRNTPRRQPVTNLKETNDSQRQVVEEILHLLPILHPFCTPFIFLQVEKTPALQLLIDLFDSTNNSVTTGVANPLATTNTNQNNTDQSLLFRQAFMNVHRSCCLARSHLALKPVSSSILPFINHPANFFKEDRELNAAKTVILPLLNHLFTILAASPTAPSQPSPLIHPHILAQIVYESVIWVKYVPPTLLMAILILPHILHPIFMSIHHLFITVLPQFVYLLTFPDMIRNQQHYQNRQTISLALPFSKHALNLFSPDTPHNNATISIDPLNALHAIISTISNTFTSIAPLLLPLGSLPQPIFTHFSELITDISTCVRSIPQIQPLQQPIVVEIRPTDVTDVHDGVERRDNNPTQVINLADGDTTRIKISHFIPLTSHQSAVLSAHLPPPSHPEPYPNLSSILNVVFKRHEELLDHFEKTCREFYQAISVCALFKISLPTPPFVPYPKLSPHRHTTMQNDPCPASEHTAQSGQTAALHTSSPSHHDSLPQNRSKGFGNVQSSYNATNSLQTEIHPNSRGPQTETRPQPPKPIIKKLGGLFTNIPKKK